jgi:hypothetical protein
MSDILQLQLASLPVAEFSPTSRYARLATSKITLPDGRTVVYLQRRFVPKPEIFSLVTEHQVRQGERLDHIAAAYFGDPELFWRLCDANRALKPEDLTAEPGRRLRITLSEGVNG